MLNIPSMLMIAGNSRNAGKTTFACHCIRNWSKKQRVVALKVTSIRPGEKYLHGSHTEEVISDFEIMEEKSSTSLKDTSRMLAAGAEKVYYIRTNEDNIVEAFLAFRRLEPGNTLFVCESRSLRKIIKPGAFVLLMRDPPYGIGKNIDDLIHLADKVCFVTASFENETQILADSLQVNANNSVSIQ